MKNLLTDRQRKAIADLYYVRKGAIRRYKNKRPFRSDAYIANEAKTLALNAHRMPSEMTLLLGVEQKDFLFEMAQVWEHIYSTAELRGKAEEEVRLEILS